MIGTRTLSWSPHVQTFLSCLSSLCRLQKVLNPDLTLDSLTENPWPSAGLCPAARFQACCAQVCRALVSSRWLLLRTQAPTLPLRPPPSCVSFHSSGKRPPLPPCPSSVVDVSLSAFSVLLGDRSGREWLCLGLDTSSATCWASLVA